MQCKSVYYLRASLILTGALTTLGCGTDWQKTDEVKAKEDGAPQAFIDSAVPVCMKSDSVEYLYVWGVRGGTLVPHLKPDGTPYLCPIPVVKMRVPVGNVRSNTK